MKSLLVDALRQLEDGDDGSRRAETGATAERDATPLELEDDATRAESQGAEGTIEVAADDSRTDVDQTPELALQPDVSATTVGGGNADPLGRTLVSARAANEAAGTAASRRLAPSLFREPMTENRGFTVDTPCLQRVARYTPLLCLLVGLCSTGIYLASAHVLDAKTTFGVLPGSPELRAAPEAGRFGNAFALPGSAVVAAPVNGANPVSNLTAAESKPASAEPGGRSQGSAAARRDLAVQADPGFAIAERAYVAWRSGDAAKAEDLYREALRISPNQPDALLGLAAVLYRQGRSGEAQGLYATLLSVDPEHPAAADALLSTVAAGALGAEELVSLSERYPGSPELSFALGRRLAAMQHWPEARLLFESAFDQAPQRAEYAFNAAVAHDRVGRYRQAVGFYQRALELDTRGAAVYRKEASRRLAELSAMTGRTP